MYGSGFETEPLIRLIVYHFICPEFWLKSGFEDNEIRSAQKLHHDYLSYEVIPQNDRYSWNLVCRVGYTGVLSLNGPPPLLLTDLTGSGNFLNYSIVRP